MKLFGKGEHRFPPVDRPERYIVLDDKSLPAVEMQLSGTIVNLPGHTADSIGLLLEDGSLFCGDAAMNGFPSLNRVTIWIENLKGIQKNMGINAWHESFQNISFHGRAFSKEDLEKNIHRLDRVELYSLR